MGRFISGSGATALVVRGVTVFSRASTGSLFYGLASALVDVQRNTFAFIDATGFPWEVIVVGGTGTFINKFNIFYGASQAITVGVNVTYTGDSNVYYPSTTDILYKGTTYADIAAFKAAVTPQEAASITTDPAFLGQPRNGDARLASTSGAWAITAGATYQEADVDVTLQGLFLAAAAGV
jgi:hypothetical protein